MATTRLSDVLYSSLFLPTVIERTAERSVLRRSGIVGGDATISRFANGAGDLMELPFWNDLTGNSNVSSDDPAASATPLKIGQDKIMARKIRRNQGWQSANLVQAMLGGEDPLDVVATLVADYWVREEQRILMSILKGIVANAGFTSTHVHSVAVETLAGAVNLDAEVLTDAKALLGEYGTRLVSIIMHSRVYYNLEASRALVTGRDPVTNLPFTTWNGLNVIVSDQCPKVAGSTSGFKYTSYLFAGAAIGYAEATGAGGPAKPVEIDSSPAAGNGEGVETVWYRRHWVMAPAGISFTGTPASASGVTDAELETGTNWTKKFDDTNIRLLAVVTNG